MDLYMDAYMIYILLHKYMYPISEQINYNDFIDAI